MGSMSELASEEEEMIAMIKRQASVDTAQLHSGVGLSCASQASITQGALLATSRRQKGFRCRNCSDPLTVEISLSSQSCGVRYTLQPRSEVRIRDSCPRVGA